jgi:cellulose synthase A
MLLLHSLPFGLAVVLVQTRPINPNRDLALYGYGSVAWKNRVEWKTKQQHKMQKVSSDGEGSDLNDFDSDCDIPR